MPYSEDQQKAIELLKGRKNFFLTGAGGCGKSFLIREFKRIVEAENRIIGVTAMTGCAALLLECKAKTLHSWAGIGLGRDGVSEMASYIRTKGNKSSYQRWLTTDVLVIDESSMMPPDLLEKLDLLGRRLRRQPDLPFGGIQLILAGDFFQLPPVQKGLSGEMMGPGGLDTIRYIFETETWKEVVQEVAILSTNHRQGDPAFQKILNEVRIGDLSADTISILASRKTEAWRDLQIKPTLLFSRNSTVDTINERNMDSFNKPMRVFLAKNTVMSKEGAKTTSRISIDWDSPEVQRIVTKLDNDAPYVAALKLCEDAQVMLITNLDIDSGLVNGSRGVITDFTSEGYPKVMFLNGEHRIITPSTWWADDDRIGRAQIPLRVAYAITIHKSQGATLDCALIDIGKNMFEAGQAYVALSRVKSLEGLYILDIEPGKVKADPKVVAFYKELENRI